MAQRIGGKKCKNCWSCTAMLQVEVARQGSKVLRERWLLRRAKGKRKFLYISTVNAPATRVRFLDFFQKQRQNTLSPSELLTPPCATQFNFSHFKFPAPPSRRAVIRVPNQAALYPPIPNHNCNSHLDRQCSRQRLESKNGNARATSDNQRTLHAPQVCSPAIRQHSPQGPA